MSFQEQLYNSFILNDRYMIILQGTGVTLLVSFLAVMLGIVLGVITAFFKLSKSRLLRIIAGVYTDIIRGTPAFCQLIVIYFVILMPFHDLNKIAVAAVAFGINSGAYVSEIIRAGILSIDHGQTEAGLSLGFSKWETMRYIVGPQAVKNVLPALANEFINLIKETAVMGYIGAVDLMKGAMEIMSITYIPTVPLLTAAVIYYIIIKILTLLIGRMEAWLRRSDVR